MDEDPEYMDLTPTWETVLGYVMALTEDAPNRKAIRPLLEDLRRPLRIVDEMNKSAKAEKGGVCPE